MITRKRVGAINVIEIATPLNEEMVPALNGVAIESMDQGAGQVVIDMEKVPLVDSQALECLLDIQDACLRRGGALTLAAPTQICADVLRITQVDRMIEVFPTVVEATGSYTE